MDIRSYLKAGVVGLLGSLIMFVFIQLAIQSGLAPFNVPPSAAFLISLGLPAKPLALIAHFGYGAFWSIVLVALYKDGVTLGKGLGLALLLWLGMMLVISPVTGWGVFGFGDAHELGQDAKLYLAHGPKYLIATLVLHLIFGATLGWLNPNWAAKGVTSAKRQQA